jgi:hypothetical protein
MVSLMLGVLMLDTTFTRFPGDIGDPGSHTSVLFERVPSATARRIVGLADDAFVEPFVAAGQRLIARGATHITTSCGFLVTYQAVLTQRLSVPVITSSLLLLPLLARMMPAGQRVGVLTFSGLALTAQHLAAAGAASDTPVLGLQPGCHFQRAVYEDWVGDPHSDEAAREADVAVAANALVVAHPHLGAILLECTNFPPHRGAITQATRHHKPGLPVYDIWSLLTLVMGTYPPIK